ncbi:MAG TPA: ribosomal-protein-alanine acetyltransferase [Deltaproteobacteria bacterium]|nr:ribosomal-protein-alanine acetyltransferase [Deltaproteobacteria bacterium]
MSKASSPMDQIIKLERACFGESAWSATQVQGALAQSGAVVVVHPTGYVLGAMVLDEVELHRIGVLPSARAAGLGLRLFQEFTSKARARGAEKLFLEVREDNVPARRLYATAGLHPEGVRPRYYADGCAAVLYTGALFEAAP